MGTAFARLAAKARLRNGSPRCHERRLFRSYRDLFWNAQWSTVRLSRRRPQLAKNSRWLAFRRLHSNCFRRLRRGGGDSTSTRPFRLGSRKVSVVQRQIALAGPAGVAFKKEELIVPVTFHIPGALREFTGGGPRTWTQQNPQHLFCRLFPLFFLH